MIKDKVVAITGASSGMGEATALLLAERGVKLVLGARGEDKLKELTKRITDKGGAVAYKSVDVAKRTEVQQLVDLACTQFGRLDVLVSNAGVMPIGPLDDLAVDDWEQMVDVNIKGVLYGIAAALPLFRRQGSGHFINVASTAARKIVPNQAIYAGTKAAVVAISEGLRQETAKQLRVTVLFPGYTATNFAQHVKNAEVKAQLEKSGKAFAMPPEAIASAIAYAIDQPDTVDVAEIVVRSTAQA